MHDEIHMKQEYAQKAYEHIKKGGLIICPTKVGYILAGNTEKALRRKFELKQRPLRKSGVILTDYNELPNIAEIPEKYQKLIDTIEESKMLCGFIMVRKEEPFVHLDEFTRNITRQPNGTSCFVINHGEYSEYLADQAKKDGTYVFASSANKSGTGNRGRFENIGDDIVVGADYAIEHNEYVAQNYEPDSGEQGVMISLKEDKPIIIREGLNLKEIEQILKDMFGNDGYEVRHGDHP